MDDSIQSALLSLMLSCGEQKRPGIEETPSRFIKAIREMTSGYNEDPATHLRKTFTVGETGYRGIVVSRDINFVSLCEHHMLPFSGVIHIGYIPQESGSVVGLSKLARMALGYSRRFQIQEQLTQQILEAIQTELTPKGVIVVIKARHTCQCHRGVGVDGSMVTCCLRGVFEEPAPRAEFMSYLTL